jgi:hypothetical protein
MSKDQVRLYKEYQAALDYRMEALDQMVKDYNIPYDVISNFEHLDDVTALAWKTYMNSLEEPIWRMIIRKIFGR